MTLRTRLLLAQAPLAAGLVLVGLVALNTLETLGQSSQLILRDNFNSVLAAQRMKEGIFLDDENWKALVKLGEQHGVKAP